MTNYVLVVDDDSEHLASTVEFLEESDRPTVGAGSCEEAVKMLLECKYSFGVVVVDYRMPNENGAETIRRLKEIDSTLLFLVYSGDKTQEAILNSWESGAVKFIEKSEDWKELLSAIDSCMSDFEFNRQRLSSETQQVQRGRRKKHGLVWKSVAMDKVAEQIEKYKNEDVTLIIGESGTGKELVAQALKGTKGNFRAVNCAAWAGQDNLIESELFGHVRGAFTGADRDKIGVLEDVRGGTVFFDELHTLSLVSQAKLLRAIESRKIRRVGGTKEYDVDFRVVAAVKPNISRMCENGEFIPDLYYRLDVCRIEVPPLRERPEDLDVLVPFFIEKLNIQRDTQKVILGSAIRELRAYAWPGNIRELSNVISKAYIETNRDEIDAEDVARFLPNERKINISLEKIDYEHNLKKKQLIVEALKQTQGNKVQASKLLRLKNESNLRALLKKFGINVQKPSSAL